jgi:hypothetical protein
VLTAPLSDFTVAVDLMLPITEVFNIVSSPDSLDENYIYIFNCLHFIFIILIIWRFIILITLHEMENINETFLLMKM